MFMTAVKGVAAHKLRLVLTALAIVMGVAFVAGTFVFTDTIAARFDTLFDGVYAGIDATVRAGEEEPFEAGVLADVRAVDGVRLAAGSVGGVAQIVDAEGRPLGGFGPPTLGFSWSEEPALNILSIAEGNGRPPEGPREVVIDAATVESQGLRIGDDVTIQVLDGTRTFELVGIANFGTEDNLAGATLSVFELGEAQRLFGLEGSYTSIDVVGDAGVDAGALAERIDSILPAELEAVTGDQQTQEQLDAMTDELGFVNTALLAFAGVAVFVGAFIIQNTFRIIVGQRTRELALLRAIGATAGNVTTMVAIEALVVAVVASALGVVAGVGVAEAIKGAMNVFGVGIPDGPLTLELRTVVVGMAVGVVVTMVAAIIPARKAASVPPVAAMRAEAVESTDHSSLARRAWSGTALTLAGAAAIAVALVAEVSNGLTVVAAGALTAFIGVSVLAPLIARPVANAVGAPLRGIVGRLARENTLRNPRRTSSTASALMIGVALVAFVSIFAASIKASVSDTVSSGFPTDLAFASTNQMMGVTDPMLAALGDVEEIETLSAVRVGGFEIDGVELDVAGVDPATIGAVYAPSASIELDELGDGILVQVDELAEHGWAVGDTVSAAFPQATYDLAIEGTFEDQSFGNYLVSAERFEQGFQDGDAVVAFARLASGIDIEAGREAAKTALSSFPTVDINTKSDQIAEAEAQIDQLVALFTGLLGLALLIAVMGIANTLALSIVERTRELGLLRAVGMDRSQVRSMIRWEAVIVALFGTLMGLGVGSVLGWAVIASLGDDGLGSFAFPATQLATWAIAGGLAGVVAAVFPARSAARLNVLEAISYE